MKLFKFGFLLILFLVLIQFPILAEGDDKSLSGAVADRMAEAQEKLLSAKGSYKTIRMQEDAIKNMRRATKLSLKASRLRARAERMQMKADSLVNKANLAALSRGLYITNPLAPLMMQPPPAVGVQASISPVTPPVPGEPINVTVPREEEVSNAHLPSPPVVDNY